MHEFYEDNPTYFAPLNEFGFWQADAPASADLSEKQLEKATRYLEGIPQAFSFLVVRHGRLVWEKYLHGSARHHSNNIHSASKPLIGALVGAALKKGFLKNTEQTLGEILGGRFKVPTNKQGITVEDLLTHRSGIDWEEDDTEYTIEDKKNWVQAILNLPMAGKPGKKYNYSTGDTHLLSAVLTESSGKKTCKLADELLFNKMEITPERWGRDPQGYSSGGCNVYLTAHELAKLGYLFVQKGEWHGEALLDKGWVDRSWKDHVRVDSVYGLGYLWWTLPINGKRAYKMWGWGGQYVYIIPELDLMVALTADTKKEFPEMDGDKFMANYVLPALTKQPKGLLARWFRQ